jgi:pimeloyl-ACP methyl ester carboxylesterase
MMAIPSRGLLLLAILCAGCTYRPRPATVPLRTLPMAQGAAEARCLVVFLPGRGDVPEDYIHHGFPERLQRAGSRCAMVGVDSHLGYFFEKSIVKRLREDVIAPAQARGFEEVWLVGISLGGLGSLLYAREHPEDVDGLVLLAPYLGEKDLIEEVARTGGIRSWAPRESPDGQDLQDFRRLWVFLRDLTAPGSNRRLPVYLGYGKGDRFARPNGMLAEVLPPDHVFTTRGGHTWRAWSRLWDAIVTRGAVPGTGKTRS